MEDLYTAVVPGATRLAYVLTGDRDRAAGIGRRTFVGARARFLDVRDPVALETWTRRHVIRRARHVPCVHPEGESRLWAAFLALPPRLRAALALRLYEGMDLEGIGDVMELSPARARALLERGLERVRAAVGAEAGDLAAVLAERAETLDGVPEKDAATARRARLWRVSLAALLVFGIAAGGVGGLRAVRLLRPTPSSESAPPPSPRRAWQEEERVDRSPAGAPSWCPRSNALRRVRANNVGELNFAAFDFTISLVHDYRRSIASDWLRSPRAPHPSSWPRPDTARLRVLQSGPARKDSDLAAACGVEVAARTWKVVFEQPEGFPDVFAVYLAQTEAGSRVWATLLGPPRGGLDPL